MPLPSSPHCAPTTTVAGTPPSLPDGERAPRSVGLGKALRGRVRRPPRASARTSPRRPRRARTSRRPRSPPGGRGPSCNGGRARSAGRTSRARTRQRVPPLLREAEPHDRTVGREGGEDDVADTELDAATDVGLVAPRQRQSECADLVDRHHDATSARFSAAARPSGRRDARRSGDPRRHVVNPTSASRRIVPSITVDRTESDQP